ncbi:glutaredoxin family protein [Miltoncostaea oceani]|uniref:glutaredoxin family protein n=1 Tax=Miltoncostaea oceani TaxID=2843216 RepID=UPI001C3D4A34|nr:glutaredoxin family protein [Miltoncostaea oceani]
MTTQIASATITLYTRPGCPGCRMSKQVLERNGVEFESRDVSEDADALAAIQTLGYTSLPVVVAGLEHWSGYQPDRLQALSA